MRKATSSPVLDDRNLSAIGVNGEHRWTARAFAIGVGTPAGLTYGQTADAPVQHDTVVATDEYTRSIPRGLLWLCVLPARNWSAPLIDADGTIYCVCVDQEGDLLVAVSEDGAVTRTVRVPGKEQARLALTADGGIIVSVSYGILMALAPDGSVLYLTAEWLYASDPLVAGDGTIYLG